MSVRSPFDLPSSGNSVSVADLADIVRRELLAEDWRIVGTVGQPAFTNGFGNFDLVTKDTAAFYRDSDSVVHLRGCVASTDVTIASDNPKAIWEMPTGYRPAKDQTFIDEYNSVIVTLTVTPAGLITVDAATDPGAAITAILLMGISYRVT